MHEFKLRHNDSQTVANINVEWVEGFTCDLTVWRVDLKLRSGDTSLEDQAHTGRSSESNNQIIKHMSPK